MSFAVQTDRMCRQMDDGAAEIDVAVATMMRMINDVAQLFAVAALDDEDRRRV